MVSKIQGGAMNRGLLFAGPPPLPLGGCERKAKQNRLGGRQFPCYIAGRQLIAKSFAWGRTFTKICAGPSVSRSLVLMMKKLLNDGLDLMSPEGRSLMENTPFGGFSAGLHC
jgi:hypothetical protein